MEKLLTKLFDYQKFAKNKELEMQIDKALNSFEALDFDALGAVVAAGDQCKEIEIDKNKDE